MTHIPNKDEREAAAKVSLICIAGGPISAWIGYLIEDRNASTLAFIFAFALIIVGFFAGLMAAGYGLNEKED